MDTALRWAAWDAFVAGHRHGGFMQSTAWARCRAGDGFEPFTIMLSDPDSGAILGGALVCRRTYDKGRQCFYYVQEGPLLPDDPEDAAAVQHAFMERIAAWVADDPAVVSHLRIEPRRSDWPAATGAASPATLFAPAAFDDRFSEPRRTRCIDLRQDEAALLAGMRPKGRYNIAVARRHGVEVVRDCSAQAVADFISIQATTADRHGLGRFPGAYFRAICDEFGDDAWIFFAQHGGTRLATALVVRFGERATYFFGGSLVEQRSLMAPYLLHHEVMLHARRAGCLSYDLWGVAPPGNPDHRWAGISEFKRKFGGSEVGFVPTLDHVFDRVAYRRYGALEGSPRKAKAVGARPRSPGTVSVAPVAAATTAVMAHEGPATTAAIRTKLLASTSNPALAEIKLCPEHLPPALFAELISCCSPQRFGALMVARFPFYKTTFWYPFGRSPENLFERVIEALRPAANPSARVVGVEWWFSVLDSNATPLWLLPNHFDRNDLDERNPSRISHPEWSSVLFLTSAPYGELVITDQVLGRDMQPEPEQPRAAEFVRPRANSYVVFPGHLRHGVVGRLWRPREMTGLRIALAVNWWTERPLASYLRESREAPVKLGLD